MNYDIIRNYWYRMGWPIVDGCAHHECQEVLIEGRRYFACCDCGLKLLAPPDEPTTTVSPIRHQGNAA